MAYSNHKYPDHSSLTEKILAQVKVGDVVYLLKDKEARAALDAELTALDAKLKSGAYTEATSDKAEIKSDGAKLLTGKAVYDYVTTEIADLAKAIVFRGVTLTKPESNTITIEGQEKPLIAAIGDLVIFGVKEYIYDGEKWIELGDETLYLTKDEASKTYVAKTLTIAGIDMADNITAAELAKALAVENKTALGLKALAYKDNATVTVNDYATSVKEVKFTPALNKDVKATIKHTSTPVTSTGSVDIGGNVTGGQVTATGTIKLAAESGENADAIKVSGTVAASKVTVTPKTASVKFVKSLGSQASLSGTSYTAQAIAEGNRESVPNKAFEASVSGEELVLSEVTSKVSVLGDKTTLTDGAVNFGTFTPNKLPEFDTAMTVATGIESASMEDPVFTGDKIKATFSGTAANLSGAKWAQEGVALNVSGNYDKADASADVAGTLAEVTFTPELNKGDKVITVQ